MGSRTPQPEGCSAERSIRDQTPLTLYALDLRPSVLGRTGKGTLPHTHIYCRGNKRPRSLFVREVTAACATQQGLRNAIKPLRPRVNAQLCRDLQLVGFAFRGADYSFAR